MGWWQDQVNWWFKGGAWHELMAHPRRLELIGALALATLAIVLLARNQPWERTHVVVTETPGPGTTRWLNPGPARQVPVGRKPDQVSRPVAPRERPTGNPVSPTSTPKARPPGRPSPAPMTSQEPTPSVPPSSPSPGDPPEVTPPPTVKRPPSTNPTRAGTSPSRSSPPGTSTRSSTPTRGTNPTRNSTSPTGTRPVDPPSTDVSTPRRRSAPVSPRS